MTALNNLLFKVSLLDSMSGPAKTMMSNMDRVTTKIQGGFNKIGYGAAGLVGAAYSLDSILQPAKEMKTALGEISSLDTGQQVLDNLRNTAMDFSSQYGESAAGFVHASYDIQSAISGLTGNELPAFTNASAILAKGTKADVATVTNYVGTMYGIFQKNADAMGKANWVNMLAGQTATAVKIFKTTGQGMADAFTGLGGRAAKSNIAMNEQLAVLGSLQSTMKGAEAGTGYRSFLDKVTRSQEDLGLSFLDSQNHMLPMVDILTKIKGKYGDLSDQNKMAIVSKAFGESPEAMRVIMALIGNVDGLSASIAQVGKQTGLQSAVDMAKAMTMPWDRAKESVTNLRIAIGDKMLTAMTPLYNKITEVSETLRRWTGLFPNIARYVGYAAFTVIGITAALSALSVVVGVGMLVSTGFGLAWATIGVILTPLAPLLTALRMAWMVMKMEMLAGTGVFAALKIGLGAFTTQLWVNISAIWAWNVALFSNPITIWILSIAAIVGLVAAAIIYWDTWTQAVINFCGWWWELIGVFKLVDGVIAGWEILKGWWQTFKDWISALDPFAVIGKGVDWLIEKINMIPGINIAASGAANPTLSAIAGPQTAAPSLSAMAAQPQWLQQSTPGLLTDGFAAPAPIAPPAALSQSGAANVSKGGLMSQINNANNSKTVNVGGITINNPSKPINAQFLSDELQMGVG